MSHDFKRRAHGVAERHLLVGKSAERHRLAARLGDGGGDNRTIAVIDAAGTKRFTQRREFVARRQHGDAGPAHDADGGKTAGCEHADLARADAGAFAQQRLAARDVRAGVRHELPGGGGAAQVDRGQSSVLDQFGVLDHHHGIGAAWNDAAGRDRRRRARRDFDGGLDTAGQDLGI